jgi:hypothetical protein
MSPTRFALSRQIILLCPSISFVVALLNPIPQCQPFYGCKTIGSRTDVELD